jgi:hypothetical protein
VAGIDVRISPLRPVQKKKKKSPLGILLDLIQEKTLGLTRKVREIN